MSERKTNIAANSIEHSELYRIGELICYGAYLFKTFEIYDEYAGTDFWPKIQIDSKLYVAEILHNDYIILLKTCTIWIK